MGFYKYISQLWKRPKENLGKIYKERLIQWKEEPAVVRIERPTRIDRARALGWKPKQGVIVVRVRVEKKRRMREHRSGGRRPKAFRHYEVIELSHQVIAEQRAARKFVNCEVVNSYWVGEDGQYKWYEVILADRTSPAVLADKNLSNIVKQRGRVFRGLTSAARKSRGLRRKGKGAEKLRPSANANKGRNH
ncbi:MAG: 50S ribosomal protein L15e [Candidatus Woesearchaeota archaeon]